MMRSNLNKNLDIIDNFFVRTKSLKFIEKIYSAATVEIKKKKNYDTIDKKI
jgi:hypothetical protein